MSVPFTRTLRLKVRPESHAWLNAAAIEVNGVFNYCNQISVATATRTDRKRKWVRRWECAHCGEWHDRDVNAARNILRAGSRCGTSVSGNESSPVEPPPSQTSRLREAGSDAQRAAA